MDTGRDIGWAISMMHKGGKVHRTSLPMVVLQLFSGHIFVVGDGPVSAPPTLWDPMQNDLLATDWELAGE